MKKNDPEFLATNAVREFISTLEGDIRAGALILKNALNSTDMKEYRGLGKRLASVGGLVAQDVGAEAVDVASRSPRERHTSWSRRRREPSTGAS